MSHNPYTPNLTRYGDTPSPEANIPKTLAQTKATYVHPSGDPKTAKYIIVGTQPGKSEVMRGVPFTGISGMELDNNLHAAGITKSECYFTYVIKDVDRPLGYYIEDTGNNKKGIIIHHEGQTYINQLAEELSKCSATTIITLGQIPLFVLADRTGISKWRGSVIEPTLLQHKTLLPALDPASITDKFVYKNKRLLIWDFKRAKQVATGKWKPRPRHITIRPSYSSSMQFLETCWQYGMLGNIISYDIEVDVFNGEMTCISLAYSPEDVISIPFIYERGDYFTIKQEAEVMLKIAKIIEHPNIPVCGQNLCFDAHYMLRKFGIRARNLHDTMVAQKILLPDYPVGLHFICSLYTDLPYYKDDGKYWLKGIGNWERGWRYNALDSVICADALPKQLRDIEKQGNYYTYLRKTKSISPYVYIMERGIKINVATMTAAYNNMGGEADKVLKELHKLCEFPLNPNSPKQVKEYFYEQKRIPKYYKWVMDKGKRVKRTTADEKALKRIARKGHPEASLILKLRGLGKERATFLDPSKVDTDGRMRCSYNPVGTRFARASSSENIFGTGNNLQNQPHRVLTHFIADSNYVFYGMDLSQAENRIVAYVGRISQMINAFENGEDIHGLTAKIMMNIFYGPEKAAEMSIKDLAPIGDGKKVWRDWGKKSNHGLNYDLGYKTFSLYNEIMERDGKTIVDIYHKAYPGVRNGFHAHVKQCINATRTLTNLMGRKTQFTDKLDDALYKDAYACIPQGTVGDLIDQRGLSYVYYNRDPLFRYVELCIQVHDQIGFQIPTPYHPTHPVTWEEHSIILNKIKRSLETPLYTHYKRKFVIPVDTMMGVTLNKAEGKDLEIKDPTTGLKSSCLDPEFLESSYNEVTKRWMPMIIQN